MKPWQQSTIRTISISRTIRIIPVPAREISHATLLDCEMRLSLECHRCKLCPDNGFLRLFGSSMYGVKVGSRGSARFCSTGVFYFENIFDDCEDT